jgi:hypothetical protein
VNSHPLSVMGSTLVVFCKMCMSQMAGLSHYCERDHQRTGTGDDCRQEYWKRRHKLNWTGRSNNGNKKKSGLPPQRYIGLKVHSLNCVFFKYSLKSSVFIVIYGVEL